MKLWGREKQGLPIKLILCTLSNVNKPTSVYMDEQELGSFTGY